MEKYLQRGSFATLGGYSGTVWRGQRDQKRRERKALLSGEKKETKISHALFETSQAKDIIQVKQTF